MKKICFILVFCFFGLISKVEASIGVPSGREMLEAFNPKDHIAIEGYYTSANYFMVIRSSDTLIKEGREYRISERVPNLIIGGEMKINVNMGTWHLGEERPRILIVSRPSHLENSTYPPNRLVVRRGLFGRYGICLLSEVENNRIVFEEIVGKIIYEYSICLNKVKGRLFEGKKDGLEWDKRAVGRVTIIGDEPEFPGGVDAIHQFLQENIILPQSVIDGEVRGTVFVTFVVEKDGSITNVRVLRGIGGGADEEAIRVVELMPNWTPGRERGQPTRVQFNIPIQKTTFLRYID